MLHSCSRHLALGWLRQEDWEFEANLDYMGRLSQNKQLCIGKGQLKVQKSHWGYIQVVEHSPSTCKFLGLVLSTKKKSVRETIGFACNSVQSHQ